MMSIKMEIGDVVRYDVNHLENKKWIVFSIFGLDSDFGRRDYIGIVPFDKVNNNSFIKLIVPDKMTDYLKMFHTDYDVYVDRTCHFRGIRGTDKYDFEFDKEVKSRLKNSLEIGKTVKIRKAEEYKIVGQTVGGENRSLFIALFSHKGAVSKVMESNELLSIMQSPGRTVTVNKMDAHTL